MADWPLKKWEVEALLVQLGTEPMTLRASDWSKVISLKQPTNSCVNPID